MGAAAAAVVGATFVCAASWSSAFAFVSETTSIHIRFLCVCMRVCVSVCVPACQASVPSKVGTQQNGAHKQKTLRLKAKPVEGLRQGGT